MCNGQYCHIPTSHMHEPSQQNLGMKADLMALGVTWWWYRSLTQGSTCQQARGSAAHLVAQDDPVGVDDTGLCVQQEHEQDVVSQGSCTLIYRVAGLIPTQVSNTGKQHACTLSVRVSKPVINASAKVAALIPSSSQQPLCVCAWPPGCPPSLPLPATHQPPKEGEQAVEPEGAVQPLQAQVAG
jgi:hypothetical protein